MGHDPVPRRNSIRDTDSMSLYGIFSSPSQRRRFLLTSGLIVVATALCVLMIYLCSPGTRGWNLLLDVLVGLLASAIFVIVGSLYVKYFFEDPHEISLANKLLPQDIDLALTTMAQSAFEYKLFVRTGRHFRAAILPILISNSTKLQRRITIEVVLLDFRNDDVCEKYASYRASSSFDHHQWNKKYVQKEILATILQLIQAAHDHHPFTRINLYLSSRLSTFRFDGSQDQIIVTREDPKDIASRYPSSNSEFSAYLNEFHWAQEEACKIEVGVIDEAPIATLREMFDNCPIISKLEEEATDATNNPSPYVR